MKYTLIVISILVVLCVGVIVSINPNETPLVVSVASPLPSPTPVPNIVKPIEHKVIGKSVEGRNIEAYTYGSGPTHLMFVGGIHGGYEWNSVLLAYKFIDYLKENPDFVPRSMTISIIPSANPDGVYSVTKKDGRFTEADLPTVPQPDGTGRFNAHGVDLNRNFDCKWKPKSTWKSKIVSAGTSAFSEPEAAAIRDFVRGFNPAGAIFWHSKSNAVYASECEAGIPPRTLDIMNAYSRASGYVAVKSFDQYEISGDAEGWLASKNIPAITVELRTHESIEWDRNLAGTKALLSYFNQNPQ